MKDWSCFKVSPRHIHASAEPESMLSYLIPWLLRVAHSRSFVLISFDRCESPRRSHPFPCNIVDALEQPAQAHPFSIVFQLFATPFHKQTSVCGHEPVGHDELKRNEHRACCQADRHALLPTLQLSAPPVVFTQFHAAIVLLVQDRPSARWSHRVRSCESHRVETQ